jgi:ATP-binding cassette subfamily B protein
MPKNQNNATPINEESMQQEKPQGAPMSEMGQAVDKPKNFFKSLGKLIKYLKPYTAFLIIAVILAGFASAVTIIGPDHIRQITDIIEAGIGVGIDMAAIARIGIMLACLFVVASLASYIQHLIMADVTQRACNGLRKEICNKINNLPLKYFDTTSHGDILSRVTNDTDAIGQTLYEGVGTLTHATIMLLGSIIMMLITSPLLAVIAMSSSVLGFIFMGIIISNSQKHFKTQQKSLGELNGHVEEMYSGHTIVKVYNAQEKEKKVFKKINNKLYMSAWKSQFLSGLMMPFMGFIGNLGYVTVCVAGAVFVSQGRISIGVVAAFLIYIRFFTNQLSQIAQGSQMLLSSAAASERIFEFLEETELPNESHKQTKLNNIRGAVEFKNVKFGYNEDKIIIHNFSASIKAGQKVAIVGPTGAGKTTLVNLLMRFYELNEGEILIDNMPVSELTRENVHDLFCMVLQDSWLFEGTIKENIVYSKTGISDDDVYAACRAAGVDHFIRTLPHGYNTVLTDKVNLSQGQRQLLTIARAMADNAPMIILDEATSSVDTRTEILIQQAMDELMKGRTSFVIAHRLSTIKNADLILVMNNGDIVESGTHGELLNKNGFYANLYNSQFEM